ADLQTLEKLSMEFADELAMLGIKTTSLEDDMNVVKEDISVLRSDVDAIKDYVADGGFEKVKISGDMIVRHSNLVHRNDWTNYTQPAAGALPVMQPTQVRAGSSNNVLTESQFRLKFTAEIDENITMVARWVLFAKNSENVNGAQSNRGGAFGNGGIGNLTVADSIVNLAHLNVRNMFRFGGDFTFGRVIYISNHGLLVNNYLDVVKYTKKVGDVDALFQAIYGRHVGNYNDSAAVDSRPVWNLDLKTKWHDHNLYAGFFVQDEPNALRVNAAPFGAAGTQILGLNNINPVAGGTYQTSDKRWDVEFGSKGQIGKNGHWNYDLGFAYTNYELDVTNTAATTWISPEMQGWMGHVAAKWDSKNQWTAKVSYTFADDETPGAISIINDMRYVDFYESPSEDIGRGNTWFARGLRNMSDTKLQTEYRPNSNSKHYFRLAGDILRELKDAPVNDLSRYLAGNGLSSMVPVANKDNTAYDTYNNVGIAEPDATVITFEYRYQLAQNTRIRSGLTIFDFCINSDAQRNAGGIARAGRGLNNDYDYMFFWVEIYSKF
ncbi:MAG: hypothetical protein ACD_39C00533G0001, partial [uncultured bacterium]